MREPADSVLKGELGAPAAAAYKNQSGGILDTLADMNEKAYTCDHENLTYSLELIVFSLDHPGTFQGPPGPAGTAQCERERSWRGAGCLEDSMWYMEVCWGILQEIQRDLGICSVGALCCDHFIIHV